MNEEKTFVRIAAISSLLTTLFIIGNVVTLLAAVGNDTAAFTDASLLLLMGPRASSLFHASMVFDVLAYLAFVPVVVFFRTWLRDHHHGLLRLLTFCGASYSLIGALGAVIVDAVLPRMMHEFAAAAPAQQEILKLLARYFYLAVEHGLWNPLEVLLVSFWFLGTGLLLRSQRRGLAILALLVGALGLLDPLGWVFGSDTVMNIGALGTVLLPVWTAWFGIDMLRRPGLWTLAKGPAHAAKTRGIA